MLKRPALALAALPPHRQQIVRAAGADGRRNDGPRRDFIATDTRTFESPAVGEGFPFLGLFERLEQIQPVMGAGAVIGIIIGVLAVLGVGGFFAYRYMNAKRQDDEKQFMQDYPASKVTETNQQTSEANSQNTPTEYDFTTLDAPSTKSTPDPMASSIAMLHAGPGSSPSPSQEPTRYNFDPAQSTVNGAAPSTSPFNRKDAVQASRPSNSNFEAHSMEFNAVPGSYAESFNESYAGSFAGSVAGSYANSFSGTYNGQGVLNSFDGSVDDFGRDTVGTTVSEALERQSEVPAGEHEPSHWMDDMRGTNDSYAMLESGSFDRTSALSRFSTDSDLNSRPTQT